MEAIAQRTPSRLRLARCHATRVALSARFINENIDMKHVTIFHGKVSRNSGGIILNFAASYAYIVAIWVSLYYCIGK